jgi:TRAP-type C4-dicarboxylate transport system permease small subunit
MTDGVSWPREEHRSTLYQNGEITLNRTNKIIVAFLLATIAGFFIIAGGFLIWADQTNFSDREGSVGMGVIFVFAPLGGIILGVISAIVTARTTKPTV